MNVVISPYSKQMRNGQENPKNYPYWSALVSIIKKSNPDLKVIQIGVGQQKKIDGINRMIISPSMEELTLILKKSEVWISVDNFINHFGTYVGKKGIVLWGKSNPKIFGYDSNFNILKDEKHFRKHQFAPWEEDVFDESVFLSADIVYDMICREFPNVFASRKDV